MKWVRPVIFFELDHDEFQENETLLCSPAAPSSGNLPSSSSSSEDCTNADHENNKTEIQDLYIYIYIYKKIYIYI